MMFNPTEVLQAKNLTNFKASEVIAVIDYLINELRETKKESLPGKILELITYLKRKFVGKQIYPIAEILESDYWFAKHLIHSKKTSEWNSKMRQQQLFILENLFTEYEEKTIPPLIWNNICITYSEALMNIGRPIEALAVIEKMIENEDFYYEKKVPQTGWGLLFYSTLLKGTQDKMHCIYNAHQKLKTYKENIKDKDNLMVYQQRFKVAEDMYEQLGIDDVGVHKGGNRFSGKEKVYRKWCAANRLFLNGSNDIDLHSMVQVDAFLYSDNNFPNETHSFRSRVYQNFLNSLSQEFITLRWLLFDTIHQSKEKPHLADNDLLFNNEGMNVYSIRTDLLKTVYRMSYSIFDKIGYFLNHFYNLSIPNNKASLNHIWFIDEDPNKPLKKFFKQKKNDALQSLYWLSRDIYGYDKISEQSMFVKKISHLRNMMEHSYLQVTEYPDSLLNHESGIKLNLDSIKFGVGEFHSHNLSLNELEKLTMDLTKKTRNALLYLKFAVDHEAGE
ncbi:hypothetical protein H1D32_07680 [Anaerobacillus sp. CMMVII]|uniref:LA2681 family HEPN domain-containing protein n=1 Tax=Anaerobacillus sp. CMMVII TaxID=2755588 RepID=UPI0021B8468F|nr:LA2681 family HEPN domain-containing protein [Anaerobacillus sp. CMMVII]MCT8137642.1 hypothetical protein [Anaerobacillus sp. CMMVII]